MIELRDVSRAFRKGGDVFWAVEDVDLTIEEGSFVAVVGPSGCGKSTLLNMIAGLGEPTLGSVHYDGEPVTGVNTAVGYVTQKDNLMPWRDVRRNIALALEIQGVPRSARQARVDELIRQVGLLGFERHLPAELSGGMQKRAALARTLAYRPQTLLMDEPFGALDAQLRLLLQEELLRLWADNHLTVVFVTHDLTEAIGLADRVVVMSGRPGRILSIEECVFPRPRDLASLSVDPAFRSLHQRLWSLLRPELSSAK